MPVLNLSGVKSNNFENLPAGSYVMEIVDVEERVGKDSGKPYLWVELAVPADNEQFGRGYGHVFCNMTYDTEDNKAFMLVGFLQALGYTQEDLANIEIDEAWMAKITNKEVGVKLRLKTDSYGEKNEVRNFFAV